MTAAAWCDIETCPILADDVTAHDVERTVASLPLRWHWLLLGLPPEAGTAVGPYLEATAAAMGAEAATVDALRRAVDTINGPAAVAEVWHLGEHAFSAAGRALAAAGFITPQAGVVAGLFASAGLPKEPVVSADVGRRGLLGDVQRNREHHGRPSQALCLWSAEVVEALAAAGHPIAPGAAGENISVRGVDWSMVRPGSVFRIGGVSGELSGWALPCAKNRRWFAAGDDGPHAENRIDPDLHPGWSRAYAYVLADPRGGVAGTVAVGDSITFE